MFGVLVKKNNTEKMIFCGSLANCQLFAENLAMDIIEYYDGSQEIYFLKNHNSSSQVEPTRYGMYDDINNCIRLYKHIKNSGYIYSNHEYIKFCKIKIFKIENLCSVSDVKKNRDDHIEIQLFRDDKLLKIILGTISAKTIVASNN